jgi:hypothetical protein
MSAELVHIKDESENLFIKCKFETISLFFHYLILIFFKAILANETEGKMIFV